MRADESESKRLTDRVKLATYLDRRPHGAIPIEAWYADTERLGLTHSARQRLSELREDGYMIDYNRKTRCFDWRGVVTSGQLTLV